MKELKTIRIFLTDDRVDILGDYNKIPAIKTLELEDGDGLWGNPLKIDGDYYSVCCSQGENYGVKKLEYYKCEEDIEELEEFGKGEITCPVCGCEESDSWEYTNDDEDDHECGNCGSILSWTRDVTVDYTTTVKEIRKAREL